MSKNFRHISAFLMGFWLFYLFVPLAPHTICAPCIPLSACPYVPQNLPKSGDVIDSGGLKICCNDAPQGFIDNPHQKPSNTNQNESQMPFLTSGIYKFQPSGPTASQLFDSYVNYSFFEPSSEAIRAPPSYSII